MNFIITVNRDCENAVIAPLADRGIYCEHVAQHQVTRNELVFVDAEEGSWDEDSVEAILLEAGTLNWFRIEDSVKYEDVVL